MTDPNPGRALVARRLKIRLVCPVCGQAVRVYPTARTCGHPKCKAAEYRRRKKQEKTS